MHSSTVLPIPLALPPMSPRRRRSRQYLVAYAHSSSHSGRSGYGFVGRYLGFVFGMAIGGGIISEGNGPSFGTFGITGSNGAGKTGSGGMVNYAGISIASPLAALTLTALGFVLLTAMWLGEAAPPEAAGANSPPTLSGEPAGQRGCCLGSQFAFRRLLV